MSTLLDSLQTQIASVHSPLMQVARFVQSVLAEVHPTVDRAYGPAPMPTDQGPRPTAEELRTRRLQQPGRVDSTLATAEAQRTLSAIDFSRDNIVLWVPATLSHSIPDSWERGVQQAHPDGNVSSNLVNYPAGVNLNDSVATGVETLRQVLAGIAAYDEAHGTHHSVTLGGHSQGAWVIGQAMSEPAIHHVVDGAALYGHPSPSRDAHATARDPKILEVNDPNDPFTHTVVGGEQALQGISELAHGASIRDVLPKLGLSLLANPFLGGYLLGRATHDADPSGRPDPHFYEPQYASGARFLAARAQGTGSSARA